MPRSGIPSDLAPDQAVRQARTICIALLAGQVIVLGIVAYLVTAGGAERRPAGAALSFFYTGVAVFAILVPLAFVLRGRLMGGGEPPTPQRFLQAHILFFGLCEMAGLFNMVAALVAGALVPPALLAVLAMAVQAVNFPRADALGGDRGA